MLSLWQIGDVNLKFGKNGWSEFAIVATPHLSKQQKTESNEIFKQIAFKK